MLRITVQYTAEVRHHFNLIELDILITKFCRSRFEHHPFYQCCCPQSPSCLLIYANLNILVDYVRGTMLPKVKEHFWESFSKSQENVSLGCSY